MKTKWLLYMERNWLSVSLLASTLLLSGCDFFKQKKQEPEVAAAATNWSCGDPANVDALQKMIKDDYLKVIDRQLRETKHYAADQALLLTINNNLKFEIKNIRTTTEDAANATQLQCESELLVTFPKGLQQRAENAFVEQRRECDECEGGDYDTLRDSIESEGDVRLGNNQLSGSFSYEVNKTDKDGVKLEAKTQHDVVRSVAEVVMNAVQYAAYAEENKEIGAASQKYDQASAQQQQLAQKAMDIRNKELLTEKAKQVEQLNQAWDNLSVEQRTQLKQEQANWFEKRDIDCKVISQKGADNIPDRDLETYQQQYRYWSEAMRDQDHQMLYNKCFIQHTEQRSAYLMTL